MNRFFEFEVVHEEITLQMVHVPMAIPIGISDVLVEAGECIWELPIFLKDSNVQKF